MPGACNNNKNSLQIEPHSANLLIDKLKPEENDVIIIRSDNENLRIAEFATKNAALFTTMTMKHIHRYLYLRYNPLSCHNQLFAISKKSERILNKPNSPCLTECLVCYIYNQKI